jgi:AraC family transcriptional activator FtrA
MTHTIPDMRSVAVAATDGMLHFELALAYEVFGSKPDAVDGPWYDVTVCGASPVRIGRFLVEPDCGLDRLALAGTVIVPALADVEADPPADLVAAVRAAHERGARVVSLCTGVFVLAAAGLLDGRPATTHWLYTDRFRGLYPAVHLDPDVLFVDDGDVLTSAGNAACIDLLLHLVRRDHGTEVANRVARRSVVAPWREGGQSQFVERPIPADGDSGTAATRAWAVERLHDPLSLADLAGHARMSVRTFTRRFREETGTSPQQWLAAQRLALARQLLESTDHPVDRIAADAGFGTAASLRGQLRASIGVSPLTYRRTYRGPVVHSM